MATAMPRRRLNQCEVSAISGAKVADVPRNPISNPCARLNCHNVTADPAATNPALRNTAPMSTGTITPNRSESRPMRTPPSPNPTIDSVYGNDASARVAPNSLCIRGSTTETVYTPEPPIVMSTSDTNSLVHAYEDSMSCGVAVG